MDKLSCAPKAGWLRITQDIHAQEVEPITEPENELMERASNKTRQVGDEIISNKEFCQAWMHTSSPRSGKQGQEDHIRPQSAVNVASSRLPMVRSIKVGLL